MVTRIIFGATVLLCLASGAQASVIFDGEFYDNDWSKGWYTTGVGRTYGDGERSTNPGSRGGMIDGVPGAYRYSSQSHGGLRPQGMTFLMGHFYEPFVYDPALGPLSHLDMSFNAYLFGTTDGYVTESHLSQVGVAVRQNDHMFVYNAGAASNLYQHDQWFSYSFNGIKEDDFVFAGRLASGAEAPRLDFSISGAEIQFGYFTYTSWYFTTQARHGVDNWRLELNSQPGAVPEPSSVWIMIGVATCGIVVLWRKRNQSRNVAHRRGIGKS